ncbi:MAG: hypothetical protein QG555_818 [Thermodesulfobacteriota bacterium]|nr:hypothetical protein [Thermodesulfobacteriota bacterium]
MPRDNNYLKRYSIQNMGIHGKLVIIPFLVLFYAFYHHRVFLNTSQLALIAFIFLMVLGGLHMLRQIFERIISLASSVRNADAEDTGYTDVQREKDELKDLSNSLHRVLNRLEKTTGDLRRRSFELLTIRESMEAARNSLDIYHIMDMILGKAMGLTEARIGSILIAEPATEQFRVAAIKGLNDVLKKGMCIPMQSSLARQVLLSKEVPPGDGHTAGSPHGTSKPSSLQITILPQYADPHRERGRGGIEPGRQGK